MARAKKKAKKGGTKKWRPSTARPQDKPEKFSPPDRREVAKVLIGQLKNEMAKAKDAIYRSTKSTERHRRLLKDLEKRLKEAEREAKKKPARAKLDRLPDEWKRHWVLVYDDMRSKGVPKPDASAIAWANIKRYCLRDPAFEVWVCPPYNLDYELIRKDTKKARDLAKEVTEEGAEE